MPKPVTFKDHLRESRVFNSRTWVTMAGVLILALILISRMAYLQVVQYETYATQSDQNRINVAPIGPTRGLIYDRKGLLLADNQPTYSVSIIKERTADIDAMIKEIGQLIELPENAAERFKKRLQQRRRPFTAVALRYHLTEQEIAVLAVRLHEMPGVVLDASLVRNYPFKEELAHTIGYVGRINEEELRKLDVNDYSATEHIGKTGIERYYENLLHGTVGYQTFETDARGKITRVLAQEDPAPGANLKLYLDMDTQRAAIKALGDRRGSVVAIDPNTGGVLAFASMPAFDPNLFVTGIDFETYNALQHSRDRPLFNRAIQGQYPPGSTIKPIIGLAGVEKEVVSWDYTIYDPGFYKLENDDRFYRDWKKWGHGKVNLDIAIRQSCDTYFYELAHKLGIDNMHQFLLPFGLGKKTGIDMVSERGGLVPSRFWKKAVKGQPWYPGETLITGIGQGYMLTTPLQLALSTAILANRGKVIQPRMVKTVEGDIPADVKPEDMPKPATTETQQIELNNPENWELIVQSMRSVVHHIRGTARSITKGLKGYDIAGKTGTAQVVGIKQDEEYDAEKLEEWHRDHALFIAFAPVDKPRIAVAVLVENGGGGGSTAAPVARQVLDAYLLQPDVQAGLTNE